MAAPFKNGILILSYLPSKNGLYSYLKEASKLVEKKLYIDLFHPSGNNNNLEKEEYYNLLTNVYGRTLDICPNLDLNVLLEKTKSGPYQIHPRITKELNVCIINNRYKQAYSNGFLKGRYDNENLHCHYLNLDIDNELSTNLEPMLPSKLYPGVVIGGTFDRIHDGHKLLISTSLLLAEKKLTVGVADGVLLQKKILKELIHPVDSRINEIINFIEQCKPGIDHKVVPITEPCGPSGTDDDLHLLVVSQETRGGGRVVNDKRKENNLSTLDVFEIDLVGEGTTDLSDSLNAEGKISSSAGRVRTLGSLLKQPNFAKKAGKCYLIGMAGGIASGKSSVVKRLEEMGAITVNCDKLGHETYLPGQPAYDKIVQHFGSSVVAEDGHINRKKLGPIVFSDPKKLELLNSIVWPEIRKLRTQIIENIDKECGGDKIIVFEGAILFESGWDKDANEVWCCVIPTNEAIKRIQNRDGLTEEAAIKRINSQMSNDERVSRSHVILSTLWEPEFTQKQVEKAWMSLQQRLTLNQKL